ncbi:hypothetical protein M5689_018864 [Euphorbia peplus]|nr:hypothetical protein M5689_018864 [Euphorbia peplus]
MKTTKDKMQKVKNGEVVAEIESILTGLANSMFRLQNFMTTYFDQQTEKFKQWEMKLNAKKINDFEDQMDYVELWEKLKKDLGAKN